MSKKELQIVIGLNRATNKINRATANLCAKYNLTLSQFGVLEALYHKGDLKVGEVKNLILSSDGTIPVVVKNLEKNHWITRSTKPDDKRCTILQLTDEGRALIAEVYPQNVEIIVEEMKTWSEEDKESLVYLLKKFGGKHEY